MPRFVILIPTHNEKKTLVRILNKIKKYKALIIDDCSDDKTYDSIKFFKNIEIYRNRKKIGYEKSLLKGFDLLKKSNYDFIITMDADGEHATTNLYKIMLFCQKHNPDLVIGNRLRKNRFLESILSYLFNYKFHILDPLSGFKAYKVKKINFILKKYIVGNYFLVDLLVKFLKFRMTVKTMNINMNSKPKRNPKVGGFFYVNLKILSCLKFILYK